MEGVAERRRRGQNEQEKKGEMSRDGYLGAGIKWCVGRPEKRERTEREMLFIIKFSICGHNSLSPVVKKI